MNTPEQPKTTPEQQYAAFKDSRSYRNWISAQQIGLQAHFMKVARDCGRDDQRLKRWQELKQKLPGTPHGLSGFPPFVLHLLRGSLLVTNAELGETSGTIEVYRKAVGKTLVQLGGGRNEGSSTDQDKRTPLAIAQVIAFNIMGGNRSAKSLMRLGLALCKGWKRVPWRQRGRDEKSMAVLAEGLSVLRSNACSVFDKVAAICAMSDGLSPAAIPAPDLPALPYWAQVRNALFQQVFSWPLLVTRLGDANGTHPAVSLPVAIDVGFDGLSKCNLRPVEKNDPLVAWRPHLEKAVDAAKVLWFAGQSNSRSFRQSIIGASVTFHFDIARDILQTLPLQEGSAEGYFAQVILARLLVGRVINHATNFESSG